MDNQKLAGIDSFLGRGWAFPPQFNKSRCTVEMVAEAEDIYQSLEILLSTRLGERIRRPNYGCNLDKMIFENANTQFITFVQSYVERSVLYHEPRIQLDQVVMNTESYLDGLILIDVQYTIRATNSPDNYVYPFYLEQA
ncbi:MAG: GPW/gp25 family protein, partial [Bacteroidota bacterium]